MKSDTRFTAIQKDPKFQRPRKSRTHVKIDGRFASMINDPTFDQAERVDKYGRKQGVSTRKTVDLKRFYQLDEDKEHVDEERRDINEDDEHERRRKMARGEIAVESSSDEEQVDDGDDFELEEGVHRLDSDFDEVDAEEHDILDTNDVPKGDSSRRFAVVNMDWDNICANDLFKVFDAFKPQQGVLMSVKIYPSEFGKERMAYEEKHGPPSEIFKKVVEVAEETAEHERLTDDLSEHEDEDESELDQADDDSSSEKEENLFEKDEGENLDRAALRKYQLERLRYFYAVVECDSVHTAKSIFEECDGTEYEHSSTFLDLRYIPDDMSFDGDVPKYDALLGGSFD